MEKVLEWITVALIALNSWWTGPAEVVEEPVEATLVKVIDGDTIDVFINGETKRVRYIGIDTPELSHEGRDEECYATAATKRNQELLAEGQMVLLKDHSEVDKYNRLLRYVYVDGRSVGATLVAEGYAKAVYIKPDVTHYKELKAGEVKARAQGAGLWSACS